MLSWIKKLLGKPPAQSSSNPGDSRSSTDAEIVPSPHPNEDHKLTLKVKGPAGERSEEIDLVELLARVWTQLGREHTCQGPILIDRESGFQFRPSLLGIKPAGDLSLQTCTAIDFRHPTSFPQSIFEYQHSQGATGTIAVLSGFENWAKLDLPVLLDSLELQPTTCTTLEIELPGQRKRRIVLGPVQHWAPKEALEAAHRPAPDNGISLSHPPFCPCCLFSQSAGAFQPLVEADGSYAIRLYGIRDGKGNISADCRVNGEDFADGQVALIAYTGSWAPLEYESRKQYILIQDQPLA